MNSWPDTVSVVMAVGGAVLVAVGHGLVVDGENAVAGDGDAEGVAGDLPDVARQIGARTEPGEGVAMVGRFLEGMLMIKRRQFDVGTTLLSTALETDVTVRRDLPRQGATAGTKPSAG